MSETPKATQIFLRIRGGMILGATSIAVLGAYVVVGHILGEALSTGMELYQYDWPQSKSEGFLKETLGQFRANGYQIDEQKLCLPIADPSTGAGQTCGFEQISQHLFGAYDSWRQRLLQPTLQTLFSWSLNSGNAFNMYEAAKLFYSNVVWQVHEKRRLEKGQEKLPYYSGFSLGVETYSRYALDPLPLFASSPLFGLGQEPIWKDLNQLEGLRDETLLKKEQEGLQAKLRFANDVATGVLARLGKNNFSQTHPRLIDILNNLKRNELQATTKALLDLHELSQAEPHICRVDPQQSQCPFTQLSVQLKDPRLFELYDVITHQRKTFPYMAGYVQRDGSTPSGPYPLGPGSKFLQSFSLLVRAKNIDEDWYPQTYHRLPIKSLAHYLMLSSTCGQDPAKPQLSQNNGFLGGRLSFEPPRLPLKDQAQICSQLTRKGAGDEARLYHGFYLNRGEYISNYSDLLYQNLNLTPEQFEQWWKLQVFPLFDRHLRLIEQDFDKDVLNDDTRRAFTRSDRSFWFDLPKGVLQSLTEEMEMYFNEFLDPLAKDAELNSQLESVQKMSSSDKARAKDEAYLKLRRQFWSHWQMAISLAETKDRKSLEKIREGLALSREQLSYFFQAVPATVNFPNVLDLGLTKQQVSYAWVIFQRMAALEQALPSLWAFSLSAWLIRDQDSWQSLKEEPPPVAPTPFSNSP